MNFGGAFGPWGGNTGVTGGWQPGQFGQPTIPQGSPGWMPNGAPPSGPPPVMGGSATSMQGQPGGALTPQQMAQRMTMGYGGPQGGAMLSRLMQRFGQQQPSPWGPMAGTFGRTFGLPRNNTGVAGGFTPIQG